MRTSGDTAGCLEKVLAGRKVPGGVPPPLRMGSGVEMPNRTWMLIENCQTQEPTAASAVPPAQSTPPNAFYCPSSLGSPAPAASPRREHWPPPGSWCGLGPAMAAIPSRGVSGSWSGRGTLHDPDGRPGPGSCVHPGDSSSSSAGRFARQGKTAAGWTPPPRSGSYPDWKIFFLGAACRGGEEVFNVFFLPDFVPKNETRLK